VAAPARRDAVQLLTVHGAKGLEARAVFVMDADPEPLNSESATLLIDWPVDAPHPTCCAFVYSELNGPPSLDALRDRELVARRREELNGLYVAMTRARERLVFSATEPFRPLGTPTWWSRIEQRAALQAVPADGHATRPADTAPIRLRALPRWNCGVEGMIEDADPPVSVKGVAFAAPADDASRLGQAVHRVLEWAAARPGFEPDLARLGAAAAREFGAPPREVTLFAERIWTSPACARFFGGPALRWAGNEVTLADAGEMLRIDRLVALADGDAWVWWVLDYKLHHAPEELEAYRLQLARYVRAVQALQPGAGVRCAFITGAGAVIEVEALDRVSGD
jgi:ATP-dependent helicase/nuclease subunit A